MPTYTARCSSCGHEQDYVARVADREKTPTCEVCESATHKIMTATQISAMGVADNYQMKSPIDGSMIYGRSQYYDHMKKHDVIPLSDIQGQADHVAKRKADENAKQRRDTIERAIHQSSN